MNVVIYPRFSTASCVSLKLIVLICLLYPCPYQYPYLIQNPHKKFTISISSHQIICTCTMGSSFFVSSIFLVKFYWNSVAICVLWIFFCFLPGHCLYIETLNDCPFIDVRFLRNLAANALVIVILDSILSKNNLLFLSSYFSCLPLNSVYIWTIR